MLSGPNASRRPLDCGWVKSSKRLVLSDSQRTNPVKEHARRAAIVLVVVEDAMPNVGIAARDPAIKPLDRRRPGRVRVAPLKPQILGQRLDREIPRRPFGRLKHHVEIKI